MIEISSKKFFTNNILNVLFILFFVSFRGISAQEISVEENVISNGKSLFEENCTVCHSVHEDVIGPALSNVYDRRDISWIKAFIKNSQKVIHSGDEYAVNLYEKYGRTQMTSFDFNDDQVGSMLSYIKYATDNPPALTNSIDNVSNSSMQDDSVVFFDGYIFIFFFALLFILSLVFFLLLLIINFLINFIKLKSDLNDLDKSVIYNDIDLKKIFKNFVFRRFIFVLFLFFILKFVITGLFSIGVQKGYSPRQPIAFSHQIHAGQYQIDCQYCHTGVMKSKNASIPSLNICMNCHSNIKKDSFEIKKIYSAIENNTPIEWIRVHNLSKLAYFNHSQHVNVGGLECQDCHGPVEEMDIIYQYSSLTMGWCIDCHRQKNIVAKGNE